MPSITLPFAAMLVIATAFTPAWAAEPTKETLSQIQQAITQKEGVLVDVREKSEWEAGHIEGAISLPISTVLDGLSTDELESLPTDQPLYIHCMVGKRALKVGNILEQRGYKVKVMKPGYRDMIAAGFPKAKD